MAQVKVTQANPAAGADFTVTVPSGKFWRLLTMIATLQTSAVVAARAVKLFIDDGTDNLYETGNNDTGHSASITAQYSFAPGCPMSTTAVPASAVLRHFPVPEMVLMPGYRIRIVTGALDVGDQWSAIKLLVDEELMEFPLNKRGGR